MTSEFKEVFDDVHLAETLIQVQVAFKEPMNTNTFEMLKILNESKEWSREVVEWVPIMMNFTSQNEIYDQFGSAPKWDFLLNNCKRISSTALLDLKKKRVLYENRNLNSRLFMIFQ